MEEAVLFDPQHQGWTDLGDRMTNFDHSIKPGTEDLLRKDECHCTYAAWNFNGRVWYADGEFHCAVWVYHQHVANISAPTLMALMEKCSEEYGVA